MVYVDKALLSPVHPSSRPTQTSHPTVLHLSFPQAHGSGHGQTLPCLEIRRHQQSKGQGRWQRGYALLGITPF